MHQNMKSEIINVTTNGMLVGTNTTPVSTDNTKFHMRTLSRKFHVQTPVHNPFFLTIFFQLLIRHIQSMGSRHHSEVLSITKKNASTVLSPIAVSFYSCRRIEQVQK